MLSAKLVYDEKQFIVPPEMGIPKEDQLEGTDLEKLAELAGRVCYDSLGQGRSSAQFHRHILDVGHLSVYRHCPINVSIPVSPFDFKYLLELLIRMMNIPGIFVVPGDAQNKDEVAQQILYCSANLQSVIELDRWIGDKNGDQELRNLLYDVFQQVGLQAAPQVLSHVKLWEDCYPDGLALKPTNHEEFRWISLFLQCGRTASHELVRHEYRTAKSQRSTRYCDESETEWIDHPLLRKFYDTGTMKAMTLLGRARRLESDGKLLYRDFVTALQKFLQDGNVPGLTARKQARGASRKFLGSSLQTEMIFSASVAQWKRMLTQRLSNPADAEIRELFSMILEELKKSQYHESFDTLETVPADDGIGVVLK